MDQKSEIQILVLKSVFFINLSFIYRVTENVLVTFKNNL